jgi:hypothetical protein
MMTVAIREIKSQYGASLTMLGQAIERCPPALWHDPSYQNPFWHVAYHVLFYTHFYLSPTEASFRPWEKHRDEFVSLEDAGNPERAPYTQDELLAYLAFCRDQVEREVDALDLEAESGFYWLPFNKLELQFYNIRHIMEHTGELGERLGATGEIEIDWVGMAT